MFLRETALILAMSSSLYVINCAEYTSIGKPDKASLSDQTLMELFLGETQERVGFQDADGNYGDLSLWSRIALDHQGCVKKVFLDAFSASGKFHLEWLPDTLCVLDLGENSFESQVDWRSLPTGLHIVNFRLNQLYGSVNFEDMPDIWVLILAQNRFSGTLDFSNVPKGMEMLNLSYNKFNGAVSLIDIKIPIKPMDFDRLSIMEETNTKPDGEIVFDINLSGNSIERCVRVLDIQTCDLYCRLPFESYLIDQKGNELRPHNY